MDGFAEAASSSFQSLVQATTVDVESSTTNRPLLPLRLQEAADLNWTACRKLSGLKHINLIVVCECFEVLAVFA
jgi:hypothetical protein